ncbi:MAG TPA: type II toxin-antitoxin system HicB family antitoxin [Candidatus Kapabacteria bacterium]|nr:type II toxin-antitoxin system HicB family antitoxin [Candidatus Kapabacteria bacterium]HPO63998.1 type II toxin-antitoxin system HicB family antitoxin [Candidatus Kapabacteria bacterium]
MNYRIKLVKSEEGYSVWCEDLPGCASQGASEEEAIGNIKEAIEDYLSVKDELIKNEKYLLVEV